MCKNGIHNVIEQKQTWESIHQSVNAPVKYVQVTHISSQVKHLQVTNEQ